MSGQNTFSAGMQKPREARDALDSFATPPWAIAPCQKDLKRLGNYNSRGDHVG